MRSRTGKIVRGYALIALATFIWSSAAILVKAVFTGRFLHIGPVDVVTISQMRTTVSCAVLGAILLATRGPGGIRIPRRLMIQCLLLGAIAVAGSNYFYYYAITRTTVATAIMLQYLAPAYVLTYRLVRREERASAAAFAAIVCAFVGCSLTVGVGSVAHLRIDALGLAAALVAGGFYAYYNIGGAHLAGHVENLLLMLYTTLGASLLWLLVNNPVNWVRAHYTWQQWVFVAVFSVLSMLVPYIFFFQALRVLDPTRAIVTSCLEPVFAVVLAAGLLGERLVWLQAVGVALVLAATLFLELRPRPALEAPVG